MSLECFSFGCGQSFENMEDLMRHKSEVHGYKPQWQKDEKDRQAFIWFSKIFNDLGESLNVMDRKIMGLRSDVELCRQRLTDLQHGLEEEKLK